MDRLFRTLTYDYTKHGFFFEKDVDALISEVVNYPRAKARGLAARSTVKFLERHQSF